mmetsp:Transcript_46307/g.72505  ORF Transcript_46307/g.72505 Transcript_46307/m.72505 type:complete len:80 (-) Transcript_46307:976-1215(-)
MQRSDRLKNHCSTHSIYVSDSMLLPNSSSISCDDQSDAELHLTSDDCHSFSGHTHFRLTILDTEFRPELASSSGTLPRN